MVSSAIPDAVDEDEDGGEAADVIDDDDIFTVKLLFLCLVYLLFNS